jgi:hypothetical protein
VLLFAASDDIEVEKQTIVLEDKLPAITETETVQSKRHEAESLTTQLGQAAERCFGVELLEPVLTSHLKAITPPLAKKLHLQYEKVMERLSLPPGLITKPMIFAKAIALSEILREYGVRTKVIKLDTLQPSLFEENSQEGKQQKRG